MVERKEKESVKEESKYECKLRSKDRYKNKGKNRTMQDIYVLYTVKDNN
jgi:hypothetical protein